MKPRDIKRIKTTLDTLEKGFIKRSLDLWRSLLPELRPWVADVLRTEKLDDIEVPGRKRYLVIFKRYIQELYAQGMTLADMEIQAKKRHFTDEEEDHPPIIPEKAVAWTDTWTDHFGNDYYGDVTHDVVTTLKGSLEQGQNLNQTMDSLGQHLTGPEFNEKRLEVIARTNATIAFNQGRLETFRQQKDFVPYVQFLSILDSRTTDLCEARNGLLFAIDDPDLEQNTPPLHYNCRSILSPVDKYEVEDMEKPGWKDEEGRSFSSLLNHDSWTNPVTGSSEPMPERAPGFGVIDVQAKKEAKAAQELVERIAREAAEKAASEAAMKALAAKAAEEAAAKAAIEEAERKAAEAAAKKAAEEALKKAAEEAAAKEAAEREAARLAEEEAAKKAPVVTPVNKEIKKIEVTAADKSDFVNRAKKAIKEYNEGRAADKYFSTSEKIEKLGTIVTDEIKKRLSADPVKLQETIEKARAIHTSIINDVNRSCFASVFSSEYKKAITKHPEYKQFKKLTYEALSMVQATGKQREKMALEVLGELRDMGTKKSAHELKVLIDNGPLKTKMSIAFDGVKKYFPEEWWDKRAAHAPITLKDCGRSGRGVFFSSKGELEYPADNSSRSANVLLHEMGHAMDHANKELFAEAWEFLDTKSKNCPIITRMVEGQEERMYSKKVTGFVADYQGRIYPNGCTEVVSMGLNGFYRDDYKMWKNDPSTVNFIAGLLMAY